jgi:antitoxin component HigA of HigAB toxin-antitoxin module
MKRKQAPGRHPTDGLLAFPSNKIEKNENEITNTLKTNIVERFKKKISHDQVENIKSQVNVYRVSLKQAEEELGSKQVRDKLLQLERKSNALFDEIRELEGVNTLAQTTLGLIFRSNPDVAVDFEKFVRYHIIFRVGLKNTIAQVPKRKGNKTNIAYDNLTTDLKFIFEAFSGRKATISTAEKKLSGNFLDFFRICIDSLLGDLQPDSHYKPEAIRRTLKTIRLGKA